MQSSASRTVPSSGPQRILKGSKLADKPYTEKVQSCAPNDLRHRRSVEIHTANKQHACKAGPIVAQVSSHMVVKSKKTQT